jgi:hypothetical protein
VEQCLACCRLLLLPAVTAVRNDSVWSTCISMDVPAWPTVCSIDDGREQSLWDYYQTNSTAASRLPASAAEEEGTIHMRQLLHL